MSLCVYEWGMASWLLGLALALAVRAGLAGPDGQPPRCPPGDPRCTLIGGDRDTLFYTADVLTIGFNKDGYFAIKCPEFFSLDNSAMPRFESQLRVIKALLRDCPAPRGSYGAVLQRLNVSVSDKLKLINAGKLSGAHLAGLGDVHSVELVNADLAPRTLAALAGLRRLLLDHVRLVPGELLQLPTSLQMLVLTRMGADLPHDVLARLPLLVNVTVRDSSNVSVAVGGALQVLALEMPAVRVPSALSPTLRSLTVFGWAERSPAPWTACALDTLILRDVMTEELPARWVSTCVNLSVLHVQLGSHLRALHATSLRGAEHLRELRLASCALEALPVGLLDDAVELGVLDLSGNFLKDLPSGLFVRTRFLHTLNLSKNRLTTDVYTSLKAVTSLSSLKLSDNDLRDSCGGVNDTVRGVSPLERLKKLTYLDLRKTNASLICRDWRENMPLLTTLDLSWNNFTTVTYADLLFRGVENVNVNLSGNNVRKLRYTKHDYQLATGTAAPSRAFITLGDKLVCDCDTYWAVRALQERPAHVTLTARCAREQQPRDVHSVALDTLVCDAPELCVAARGCTCAWRDSGVDAPARVLRVSCERAGLTRLADVLTPLTSAARRNHVALKNYYLQLYLAHNRIADLNTADFPKHLSVLDLRNNSLSLLREDTVRALLADERRHVLLAHNKLACNCSTYDALTALRAHQARLDYDALTCADGSQLSRARPPQCAPPRGLVAGLVAAGAALVSLLVIAGLLWHPAMRLRLKAALLSSLSLKFHAEPDDDERRFDVFLSFSHGDERFVRDELVARLESGPAPYRLCVHYRDWVPGGWIPAQIAASVRASRRTVAVVSAHFLRSAWARAEFQEAYALALRDSCPRLVVVLLDDPASLPLDDKLRSYLTTNTYVRWGDPWFWQKLRLALPRGRGPVPVELPPAHAEPPVAGDVCAEQSVASALNSPQSSSCSSALTSGSSTAGSAVEVRRLVVPASCSSHLPDDVPI